MSAHVFEIVIKSPAMSRIKQLSSEGKFREIIASHSEASNPEDTFLVISAYLSLGKGQEAMALLLKERKVLWAWKPTLLLKANFETRFLLKQFDQAYEDLTYFSNLPYVSQEVEEQLRDLPHRIRVEEIAGNTDKHFDEEEMHGFLRDEKDPATLLAYLNSLKKMDLMPYIGDLHALLEQEDVHDDVKSFALMLLSAHHDNTTVSFQKGGKKFTLIPAEVRMPYAQMFYQTVRKALTSSKDISVAEVAGEILDQYCLNLYPETYASELPLEEEVQALLYLGQRYLGRKDVEVDVAARKRANAIEENLSASSPISF